MDNLYTYKTDLFKYKKNDGIQILRISGSKIYVELKPSKNDTALVANIEGLKTLAHSMLTLAQDGVEGGTTFSFSRETGLEEGSSALTIMRMAE